MGAAEFWVRAEGQTAREAFARAVDDARYEHGHGGYTGTIAEKHGYQLISVPAGADPVAFSKALLYGRVERWVPGDKNNWNRVTGLRPNEVYELVVFDPLPPEWERIRARYADLLDDKWGPAACVVGGDLGGKPSFIFFGLASE